MTWPHSHDGRALSPGASTVLPAISSAAGIASALAASHGGAQDYHCTSPTFLSGSFVWLLPDRQGGAVLLTRVAHNLCPDPTSRGHERGR
jgi:hypothetical protein